MNAIKVLYYNWVDFDDAEQRGGGVSVYQRNLVDAATRRGDEVWFLSSGVTYRPFTSKPYLREVKTDRADVRKHEIVNSTILSPGHEAFGQCVLESENMDRLFADFLQRNGPFDVIHFNNLEGIPLSFLRLAREHNPDVKTVYSVHNYFAFCPQVNLWFQEKATCRDFHEGRKCVNCLMKPQHPRGARRQYQLEYLLRRFGIRPQSWMDRLTAWLIYGPVRAAYYALRSIYRGNALGTFSAPTRTRQEASKPTAILDPKEASRFLERRRHFVEAINTYVDHVLAVSNRVAELTVGFGIDPAKVQTMYIGSRFAEQIQNGCEETVRAKTERLEKMRPGHETLRVAYLGYVRRDKGFYFLLTALQKMPSQLARRLELVIAAKMTDPIALARIKSMAHRFASVTVYDGYVHSQLPTLLSGVDLGIVPILWEDNLPQVAIECVASGVPILTSDRGGAQELLRRPELAFKAGSYRDLFAKLQAIVDTPSLLATALATRTKLDSPKEHYEHLRASCYLSETNGHNHTENSSIERGVPLENHIRCVLS